MVIGDDHVSFVVWKGGELQQVATFPNDNSGLALFEAHLADNPYRNKGFFVLSNVIGEDYRYERVPHLAIRDKAAFHNQRMRQLFRGSSFFMSDTHGRDDRGKREDIVLFFGILAATKIEPWLAAITKGDVRYLTGIHAMPQVTSSFLRPLMPKTDGDSVLVTFHENDTMRMTFCLGQKLRFSRVSRIPAGADAEALAAAIKKELERTLQYLNSQRAFTEGTLAVNCICPANMTAPLTQALPGAGRLEYRFHSADALHERLGIKSSLTTPGGDSSLQVHLLCRRIILKQLAPHRQMIPYWMQLGGYAAIILLCFYGVFAYVGAARTYTEGFFTFALENQKTAEAIERAKANYEREVQALEGKPSTGQNARAVDRTFDAITARGITPTRMLYYLSGALAQNLGVSVDDVRWYVSPGVLAPTIDGAQVVSGTPPYEILEVQGTANGDSQRQVAEQAREFVQSFDREEDIFIEVLEVPPTNLGVLADEDTELERDFSLRLIWRDGENFPANFDPRAGQEEAN